jgi:dihydrofolate reductase
MKVFIIAALTADGFIGRNADHLADWSGAEDKKVFAKLTKEAKVMVMGSKTFDTIGRPLPERHTIVYTSNPSRFKDVGVGTTSEDPAQLVKRLAGEGYEQIAVCGGASIYSLFMNAGIVDELYLTVVPKLFGTGVALFKDTLDKDLSLVSIQKLDGNTLLAHYTVK